ncbi:MAG: hypothetical protein V4548_14110 [Bacteroidota bacterium]
MKKLIIISLYFLFSCGQVTSNKHINEQIETDGDDNIQKELKMDNIVQSISKRDDSIMKHFIRIAQLDSTSEDNYSLISDALQIKNIARPDRSYIQNPKYSLDNFFGVWGGGENQPVADFQVDAKNFEVGDYDGNGTMPYILYKDSIIVFYNDFIRNGKIINSTKDSLTIRWKGSDGYDYPYTRWK